MSTVGYGVGGALGLGSEITPGTGVAASLWLPFTQEGMKASRQVVETGTITGDRARQKLLDGLRSGSGDFSLEVDGANIGLPLYYANGNASGALVTADIPGRVSAAPSATPASGGTLTAGTYRYKVASVWQRTATGERYILPCSAEVSGTTASGNLTIDLAWTDPTGLTPPSGWTYYGTAIYRSLAGGAADSQKFLHLVAGTGASYSDTGAVALSATVVPVAPASAMKSHVFKNSFAAGANPLPAFSALVVKDNDFTQRFLLCRMNQFELSLGNPNSPVTAKFGIMARDYELIANPSPSVTNLRKMMAWSATVGIDGAVNETIEQMQLTLNNNCEVIPGFSGRPRNRDVGYGQRVVSGSLGRAFETHELFTKMANAERFSIDAWMLGQAVVETVSDFTVSGVTYRPIPYMMRVEVPKCSLSEAGANISGPGRMVESLNWGAEKDDTSGVDLRITVYNLTASYA